ncbi:MAG: hypothetical protein IRZ28_13940 [Steroidobacteraceae bacterium]|nr:hypothetical protein [Steroidobacteraceae bacterium]
MRINWRSVLALGAVGLFQGVASGQSLDASAELLACANVQDNFARLACYDRLNPPRGAMAAQAAEAPKAASAPAPAPAKTPAVAAAAAPAAVAAPAVSAARAEAEFGLSERARRDRNEPAGVDHIVAKVTSVSERPRGELLLKLDNGQTWTQTERRLGTLIKEGETVTISRGALGSFMLTSEAGVATRVRRLK